MFKFNRSKSKIMSLVLVCSLAFSSFSPLSAAGIELVNTEIQSVTNTEQDSMLVDELSSDEEQHDLETDDHIQDDQTESSNLTDSETDETQPADLDVETDESQPADLESETDESQPADLESETDESQPVDLDVDLDESLSVDLALDELFIAEEIPIDTIDLIEELQVYSSNTSLADGVFTGSGQGRNGTITVSVTITDGMIHTVTVESHQETTSSSGKYWNKVVAENFFSRFIGLNSEAEVSLVDTISGATLSSNGIKAAVIEALVQSEALASGGEEGAMTWVTFALAVNAAQSGDTVEITDDLTATSTLTINKDITIEGNGFAINRGSFSGAMITVNNNMNVTFQNITLDGQGISAGNRNGNIVTGGSSAVLNFKNAVVQNFVTTRASSSGDKTGLGGAVYATGTVNIEDTYFYNNTGGTGGGAIYTTGTLNVTSSSFIENKAGRTGGAIHKTGTAIITNSTFYQNAVTTTSTNTGGAIQASSGVTTIINCTIVGNYAMSSSTSAGILGSTSNTRIKNSIIIGNKNGGGTGGLADLTNAVDAGYNLVGTVKSFTLASTSVSDVTNTDWLESEPDYNDGVTPTLALIADADNPAYQNGDFTAVNGVPVPTTDQRGVMRKEMPDLGAFEAEPLSGDTVTNITLIQNEQENVFTIAAVLHMSGPQAGTRTTWAINPANISTDMTISGLNSVVSSNMEADTYTETREITVFSLVPAELTLTVTSGRGENSVSETMVLNVSAANHAALAEAKINEIPVTLNWSDRHLVAEVRAYIDYLLSFNVITSTDISNYNKLITAEAELTALDPGGATTWAEFIVMINAAQAGDTVQIADDLIAVSALTISKNIIIEGNGFAINRSAFNGAMITVSNNTNVTFQNITLDGKNISAGARNGNITTSGSGAVLNFNNAVVQNFVTAGASSSSGSSSSNNAGFGGAIYTTGTLNVEETHFYNNTAGTGGGAIYTTGTLTVTNSSFIGNKSGRTGGAVHKTGTAVITNSTFYQNAVTTTSTNTGGAIQASSGTTTIINCTIVGNRVMSSSTSAGILGSTSNTRIKNCIIIGNKNGGGSGSLADLTNAVDAGHNLVGVVKNFTLASTSAANVTNTGWLADEPDGNGGKTLNLALNLSVPNPAFQTGDFAAINGVAVPITDQRGVNRKTIPDIGAYEAEPLGNGVATALTLTQSKAVSGKYNVFTVDALLELSEADAYTVTTWAVTAPVTLPADTVISGVSEIIEANTIAETHTETRKLTVFSLTDINLTLSVTHRNGDVFFNEDIILAVTAADHAVLARERIDEIPEIANLAWSDRNLVMEVRDYVDYLISFHTITSSDISNYSKLIAAEEELAVLDPGGVTTWSEFIAEVSAAQSGDTIRIADDLTAVSALTINKNITIEGNGFAIKRGTFSGAMITVSNNMNVTFQNMTLDGQNISAGNRNGNITTGGTGAVLTFNNTVVQNFVTTRASSSGDKTGLGGAVYTTGTVNIEDSYFYNNTGGTGGGAIYTTGILNVTNSSFVGNKAGRTGGAIHKTGTTIITNSTFYQNAVTTTSTNTGGAIQASSGVTTIINCTIVGNCAMSSSTSAGILGSTSNTRIKNSIIIGNKNGGGSGSVADITNAIDAGHNLVGTVKSVTLASTSASTVTNTGWLADEPDDNGGTTPSLALITDINNPAYQKGDFAAVNNVAVPTTDQRGVLRKEVLDIGAYELLGAPAETIDAISSASLRITDLNGDDKETFATGETFIVKALLYYTGNNYEDHPEALDNPYFAMNFAATDIDGNPIDGVTVDYTVNAENPAHFGSYQDRYAKFVEYIFTLNAETTNDVYLAMNATSTPEVKTTKKVVITNETLIVNKEALQSLIAETGLLSETAYTAESWAMLQSALTNANSVVVDTSTTQSEIDEVALLLQTAITMLQLKTTAGVNKSILQALIGSVSEYAESIYTPESWQQLQGALITANNILSDNSASQAAVDHAVVMLTNALENLNDRTAIDKAQLHEAIALADGYLQNYYTNESWVNLQSALTSARTIADAAEVTQARIDEAKVQLKGAIDALQFKQVTITATANAGGTITPSGNITLTAGATQSFTIAALSGYKISSVIVNGISQGAITQYTVSDLTTNATISVTFESIRNTSNSRGSSSGSSDSNDESVAGTTVKATEIKVPWLEQMIWQVMSNGVLGGTGDDPFGSKLNITKGMFVATIGRLAKIDTAKYKANSFSDVNPEKDYAGYINWAQSVGMISGDENGLFLPEEAITREQGVAILYQYMKYLGMDLPKQSDQEKGQTLFADDDEISDLAKEAVYAMREWGYLVGRDNNTFDPKGTMKKIELTSIIARIDRDHVK